MRIIRHVPLFFYMLIIYNIIAIVGKSPNPGSVFSVPLFSFTLISGARISFDLHTLMVIIGLHVLYIEILRSTRPTPASIVRHILSLVVFIIFLVEFIVVKPTGHTSFLILTVMSLLDVIAGFTVSISTARRDITFGG